MTKSRMEAFSDGVIAIIITVMVFKIEPPAGSDFGAVLEVLPAIATFLLSFIYLAIYWNNHHHMMHAAEKVNGLVLWANMHLLFWLSLIPFATHWLYSSQFASVPAATYGVVMLFCGCAYRLLQTAIIRVEGCESKLVKAIGKDRKGTFSLAVYFAGLLVSMQWPIVAILIYFGVALLWVYPDYRFERILREQDPIAPLKQDG